MISENTFILTLDGDVDFTPSCVHLLVDLMKKNRRLGAACGRIHPRGSGLMVGFRSFRRKNNKLCLGLVPEVRIRRRPLAPEGDGAHDRVCYVLAGMLLPLPELRFDGRQCDQEIRIEIGRTEGLYPVGSGRGSMALYTPIAARIPVRGGTLLARKKWGNWP